MDSVCVHLTRRCISVLENVLIKVVDSIKSIIIQIEEIFGHTDISYSFASIDFIL